MALIKGPCNNCGKEVSMDVGEAVHNGQLVWHASYHCPHCGARVEEDGFGFPPEEVRRAIILAEGEYALQVEEEGGRATAALKVLREALNLPLTEAVRLKKAMPGRVLTGTQAEMYWLRELLASEGLRASITRVTEAGEEPPEKAESSAL